MGEAVCEEEDDNHGNIQCTNILSRAEHQPPHEKARKATYILKSVAIHAKYERNMLLIAHRT